MKTDQHKRKYLKDYRPPDFGIGETRLEFHLDECATVVKSRLQLRRMTSDSKAPLVLDGIELNLVEIRLDGRILQPEEYEVGAETLTIHAVPDRFELACEVEIDAAANTRLEGLYLSHGNFCTQCEAEGFRYITYYLDRPDVMSVFITEIHADLERYPVMLSNGNAVDRGQDDGRHWISWQDPYPKPAYLFALVAGNLACIEDEFVTRSGRRVQLQIYTEHHNRDKCDHALRSLQKAMRWDEEVYGLEYDLDLYMIVAVDDFNMGAMENKGLNVFNTKYVLASSHTATDDDYLAIEGVIAHEYFHNWTGNRVTCRDWFQLSLKEGLTVFRDQEFSADMFSRAIQRIGDVRVLRNHQFSEDAGPMAHPVRPASYQEINNFYTATVYNKGAEVVRMMHCLLGAENFRKGMDLYFERHDGQAVTTDDFRMAMQDASGVDLARFQRWYEQSGTPRIDIRREHDTAGGRLCLVVRQRAGTTRGELNRPFHMPMRLALFDADGEPLALDADGSLEQIVDISEAETRLEFSDMPEKVMISAFRGFSAPVILTTDLDNGELAKLMVCDSDAFNRWEAGQQLASRVMLMMLERDQGEWKDIQQSLCKACRDLLAQDSLDRALVAEMLVLPGEKYIAEMLEQADVHAVRKVREALKLALASETESLLLQHYRNCADAGEYRLNAEAVASRRLRNTCLDYLLHLEQPEYFDICRQQFEHADNMTDQIACLRSIVHYRHDLREEIASRFYQQWKDTALVVDKWFSALGSSTVERALDEIKPLFEHPAYSLGNPNRARSLLGALIANSCAFHQADGDGYAFAARKILQLDRINPQVAARLASPFVHWRKLVPQQGLKMKSQIETMLARPGLSNDLFELLSTSLED
ncbi:MAG: aminopeptidase N [Gammaproteobacteria bacterium]|nr:aminopeptidase N [Gammaproteobacteria bacterium]MDH3448465.1 aminopeptidase N [Gammaproteobacteria bacterium]